MMTLMVLLLAVTIATAQRGQRQGGGHDLLSELKLTTEQQAQIKAIREEGRAQMQEMRKQNPDQRPDREAMKKMHAAAQAKVEAVLTPAQREQLTAIKAERKAAWKAVDKKGMKAELKAHDETKVKPVISAARAQFDQFLSAEDKATLERLRPVFAARPNGKAGAEKGLGKAKGQKPSAADVAAKKATMEAWKTEHAAEIAELKTLTQKYAADLERLQERLQPQREQWAKEKREIISRYLPENAERAKGKMAGVPRGGKAGKANGKGRPQGKERQNKKEHENWPRGAAFLLLKG